MAQLPPRELREEIERLCREDEFFLDQLMAWLRARRKAWQFRLEPRASRRLDAITAAVCAAYRVDRSGLLSARRTAHLATARAVAMYLARERTPLSYPQIARFFHRDHTTVIYAYERVSRMRDTMPAFATALERLCAIIKRAEEGGEDGTNDNRATHGNAA